MWWLVVALSLAPGSLDRLIADAFAAEQRHYQKDATLSELAECLARHDAGSDTHPRTADQRLLRFCGDSVGLYDSGVSTLTARVENETAQREVIGQLVARLPRETDTIGAARLRRPSLDANNNKTQVTVLAIVTAHRRGTLTLTCRRQQLCSGSIRLRPGHKDARAILMFPSGKHQLLTLKAQGGALSIPTLTLSERGRYQLEVIADTALGPQVVANRALFLGPQQEATPTRARADGDEKEQMLTLINQARAQARLSPVQAHDALNAAAASHASDMVDQHYFAHVSPRYGDLGSRLGKLSIGASKATENLARAEHPNDAHDSLMASPGHRLNILDPEVTHVGIGIHCTGTEPRDCVFVIDFAKLVANIPTEKLSDETLRLLNLRRRSAGLKEVVLDARLSALAKQHSQRMMQHEAVQYWPNEQSLVDEAIGVAGAGVALDLFRGPSLPIVDKAAGNTDDKRKVGIGIVVSEDPKLHVPLYWITLIWAALPPS